MNDHPREVRCSDIEIKTAHFRYAAKKWGDENGLPVLALHGWLDNAASFDHLAPLLSDLHIIALDFPGHGYSAHRPLGMRYHFLDYIADVVNVADALRWDRFVLLGHSLGAGVASVMAGALPERVSKLVLIEGIGPMTREVKDAPIVLAKSISQMQTISRKTPPVYAKVEEMTAARAKVGDMKATSVAALVQRGVVNLEEGVTWRSDPRLKVTSPSYLTDEQVFAFLEAVQAPTLLILAESGIFNDRPYLDGRCQKISKLSIVKLPGAHHIHLDDPAPVATAIRQFLV